MTTTEKTNIAQKIALMRYKDDLKTAEIEFDILMKLTLKELKKIRSCL